MSELPSRKDVRTGGGSDNRDFARWMEEVALPVLIAYQDDELKTEAEWREAIDFEPIARKMYERSTSQWPPNWEEADQDFWLAEAKVIVAEGIADDD